MSEIDAADVRSVANDPKEMVSVTQKAIAAKDVTQLHRLDTLVFRSFVGFVLSRQFEGLQSFITSLVKSLRLLAQAKSVDDPTRGLLTANWNALTRLGQAVIDMSRDERALEFAQSVDIHMDILRLLQKEEPIASGDLAGKLGKAPQRVSNVLAGMEEHGLISRHHVGRKTLVWLGGAALHALEQGRAGDVVHPAPKSEFDRKYGERLRKDDLVRISMRTFKASMQAGYVRKPVSATADKGR